MNEQQRKPQRMRNIIFIGMPGSGKTSFGRIYALHTQRQFIDFDDLIERRAGKSIPEIFATEGEEGFRAREEKCLRRMDRRRGTVIAMGGGTLCNPSNFRFARAIGLIVHLDAPIDVLALRLFNERASRPLLAECESTEEIHTKLTQLWENRQPFYHCSDVVLNTYYSSIDCLVLEMLAIERRAHSIMQKREIPQILREEISLSASTPIQREVENEEAGEVDNEINTIPNAAATVESEQQFTSTPLSASKSLLSSESTILTCKVSNTVENTVENTVNKDVAGEPPPIRYTMLDRKSAANRPERERPVPRQSAKYNNQKHRSHNPNRWNNRNETDSSSSASNTSSASSKNNRNDHRTRNERFPKSASAGPGGRTRPATNQQQQQRRDRRGEQEFASTENHFGRDGLPRRSHGSSYPNRQTNHNRPARKEQHAGNSEQPQRQDDRRPRPHRHHRPRPNKTTPNNSTPTDSSPTS